MAPKTWREQFEQSLARYAESGGGAKIAPSLDALVEEMPLTPDWDRVNGPSMDDLHRAALRSIVGRLIPFISEDFEKGIAMCQSPIERVMLYAVALVAWEWTDGVLIRDKYSAGGLINTGGVFLEIAPQAQIDQYRVDFLLTMRLRVNGTDDSKSSMVVECDGFDWHEKTPEQASRDRERDRRLQSLGYPVYRYMGRDVWADVHKAAREAVEHLSARFCGPGGFGGFSARASD